MTPSAAKRVDVGSDPDAARARCGTGGLAGRSPRGDLEDAEDLVVRAVADRVDRDLQTRSRPLRRSTRSIVPSIIDGIRSPRLSGRVEIRLGEPRGRRPERAVRESLESADAEARAAERRSRCPAPAAAATCAIGSEMRSARSSSFPLECLVGAEVLVGFPSDTSLTDGDAEARALRRERRAPQRSLVGHRGRGDVLQTGPSPRP